MDMKSWIWLAVAVSVAALSWAAFLVGLVVMSN
jgi:hypothetical protein